MFSLRRNISILLLIGFLSILIFPSQSVEAEIQSPLSDYIHLLQDKVNQVVAYSALSRQDELRGEVKVMMLLSPDGELREIAVSESSGQNLLDEAATTAVKTGSPYPPFPKELDLNQLSIEVPILYGKPSENKESSSMISAIDAKEISVKEDAPTKIVENSNIGSADRLITDKVDLSSYNTSQDVKEPSVKKDTLVTGAESSNINLTNRPVADKLAPASGNTSKESKEPSTPEGNIVTLDECLEIGLNNSSQTKIAQEEINLANLKIRESRRSFLPNTSLKYTETTGSTKADEAISSFREKRFGVEIEQPIYYGGRLGYALEQAKANLKVAKYSYEKITTDLEPEIGLTYYNLIITKINLQLQEKLKEEAKSDVELATKRYKLGLSTEAEFLGMQSLYNQINYQVESTKRELDLAKRKFQQGLNLDSSEDITEIGSELPSLEEIKDPTQEFELEECVSRAIEKNPEILIKQYSIKFSEYEEKAARAKDKFKVDLFTFYGRSGGAYLTEPLTFGSDWSVGIKVSKPLGGTMTDYSYNEDKTSPKLGQTSRTSSATNSIGFSMLNMDSLKSFSEKKEAFISRKKSIEALQGVEQGIRTKVEEAYFDCQNGRIKVQNALGKIKLSEKELNVAKAKLELNEITNSDFLQAKIDLTDNKSFYTQSLGNYLQAIFRLNKAIGHEAIHESIDNALATAK